MIALRRFSRLGHVAVATVIFTGIANAAIILKREPTDFSSPYRLLLMIKVMLVAAMVMLALINRYGLVPWARKNARAIAWLQIFTSTELIIGLGVVALVSLFGTLNPQGI